MKTLTRAEMVEIIRTTTRIMSASWNRRVDKKNKAGEVVAPAGERITMMFTSRDMTKPTKNFTPAGGHCFNAATAEQAAAIKRKAGVMIVNKMGEAQPFAKDVKAVPRALPWTDVNTFRYDGEEYRVVDDVE